MLIIYLRMKIEFLRRKIYIRIFSQQEESKISLYLASSALLLILQKLDRVCTITITVFAACSLPRRFIIAPFAYIPLFHQQLCIIIRDYYRVQRERAPWTRLTTFPSAGKLFNLQRSYFEITWKIDREVNI